jgi:hypothetical protein
MPTPVKETLNKMCVYHKVMKILIPMQQLFTSAENGGVHILSHHYAQSRRLQGVSNRIEYWKFDYGTSNVVMFHRVLVLLNLQVIVENSFSMALQLHVTTHFQKICSVW